MPPFEIISLKKVLVLNWVCDILNERLYKFNIQQQQVLGSYSKEQDFFFFLINYIISLNFDNLTRFFILFFFGLKIVKSQHLLLKKSLTCYIVVFSGIFIIFFFSNTHFQVFFISRGGRKNLRSKVSILSSLVAYDCCVCGDVDEYENGF